MSQNPDHILLFSSSTQEEKENLYGKSKLEGRELFEKWAEKTGGRFTGIIIPNVFGPFGNPFYNSFIATFSYQLTHNIEPKIEIDSEVSLIFVDELVDEILNIIESDNNKISRIRLSETSRFKVTEVLNLLTSFRNEYLYQGIISSLDTKFKINLFNTFQILYRFEKLFSFFI